MDPVCCDGFEGTPTHFACSGFNYSHSEFQVIRAVAVKEVRGEISFSFLGCSQRRANSLARLIVYVYRNDLSHFSIVTSQRLLEHLNSFAKFIKSSILKLHHVDYDSFVSF